MAETPQKTVRFEIGEALGGNWTGHIEVPAPEWFSRVHFDTYRRELDRLRVKHPDLPVLPHTFAFGSLAVIRDHGDWLIEGVTLDEVLSWLENPAAERTQLVSWLGRTWREYFNGIVNPNESRPSYATG